MHPISILRKVPVIMATILGLGVIAPTHQARLGHLTTCQGSKFISFSPSLTSKPESTLIFTDVSFGPCVSSDPTITGGYYYNQKRDPRASCETLLAKESGEITIDWSNRKESDFSYTTTVIDIKDYIIATSTGTITSGEFGGCAAEMISTLYILECKRTGISSASGTVTLQIICH